MTNKRAAWLGIAVPLVLALVLLAVAPAAAHHKGGHENGGGHGGGSKSTGLTEDNDHNDGDTPNNVVDNGDNEHPSGKDKSVEHGNSGNQGNSDADPDDDGRGPDRSNGGADKPDGPGGVDLADQDGNNGCGNDDDFEDDNEGWCGKNPKAGGDDGAKGNKGEVGDSVVDDGTTGGDEICPDEATMIGTVCETISDAIATEPTPEPEMDALVQGERIERASTDRPSPATNAAVDTTGADVAERSAAALPFTGSGVVKLLLVAGVLMVIGLFMLKARRRV